MDASCGASPECVVRRRCVGGAWRVARGGSGIVVRAAGGEPAALVWSARAPEAGKRRVNLRTAGVNLRTGRRAPIRGRAPVPR